MSVEIDPQKFQRQYRRWRYKNTALLLASLLLFFYLAKSNVAQVFLDQAGEFGYIGAIIAGMFFVSTFTVAPAAVILYRLAELLNPIEIALLAGLGAVVGDYLIFRFLRERVFDELKPFILHHGGSQISKLFRTPYFAWLLPFIGAFIIASPLPDEAGVSILGLSQLKTWQFVAISFVLNAVGIFIVVMIAQLS